MSYASIIASAIVNWNGDADENGTGDPNDNTANGNDGTWTGTADYGTAPYGSGKSFVLDGSSFIRRDNFADATGSRSVSVWFKSTATGNDLNIVELSVDLNNKLNARLHDNGQLKCLVNTTASTVSSGLNDGEWHHLVIVTEVGVETRFYIDGTLVATMAEPGTYTSPDLFAGEGRAFNEFEGELYDVIYDDDVAWSTGDIADLYAEGTTPADETDPQCETITGASDGNDLTFHFDEEVVFVNAPTVNGLAARTLTYSSGDGTTDIVMSSSAEIQYHESLSIDISTGDFEDAAGNQIQATTIFVRNESEAGLSPSSGSVIGGGTLGRRTR